MADESGAAAEGRQEQVPEESQATSPRPSPAKRRKTTTAKAAEELWGGASDKWIQSKDTLIALDDLEVGVGLDKGQVRPLREEIYKERLRDLMKVKPDKPLDVTVWNPSLADPSMFPGNVMRGLA